MKTFQSKEGLRQEDIISPKLFMPGLEYALKKFNGQESGQSINGQNLLNLCFKDDVVVLSDNLKDMKTILQRTSGSIFRAYFTN